MHKINLTRCSKFKTHKSISIQRLVQQKVQNYKSEVSEGGGGVLGIVHCK